MIRGLRRRLALIFGLLTSLILVVMLSITCYLARSQYQLSQEILYQTQLQALTRQLQQSANIRGSWLAQMAQDENAFFYIEQNGIPLHHSAISIQDPERAALLEALRQQADALGFVPSAFETLTFTVEMSGVTYQATVCSTSDYLLFYSQDMTAQLHDLQRLTLTYCLLGGAGIAALLAVSAFLAHLATRPTERALQEQQDFIAAASHELRSPLTVIRTSLYSVRQGEQPSELEKYLALADWEAERMGRLIDDLLTLAGSGGRRWSLKLRPVELDTVCIQLYEQFLLQAQQTGHPFELRLPEAPLPSLASDQQRLMQLLSTLISNALEHTPEGTPITLAVQVSGRFLRFSVVDRGPGIPDSEKKAVFRRFYCGDQSHTDKGHFGLGLAIAKELSLLLGGRLTVSDTPGGGATFTVRFPLP